MKSGELLKYDNKKAFNSEILQQYDSEGQSYFLSYLIKKGYNLEIKGSVIIFRDILSEQDIERIIEEYNNDTKKQILRTKLETIKAIEIMGIAECKKSINKQINEIRKEEENYIAR